MKATVAVMLALALSAPAYGSDFKKYPKPEPKPEQQAPQGKDRNYLPLFLLVAGGLTIYAVTTQKDEKKVTIAPIKDGVVANMEWRF